MYMLRMTQTIYQGRKMKLRELDNNVVVDIDCESISEFEICEINKFLKKYAKTKRIGLNLENVSRLSHDFGVLLQDYAKKSKISLFNLTNDALLFLYIAKYDVNAHIYLSEEDFCENKHSFVNRRFKLLKTA